MSSIHANEPLSGGRGEHFERFLLQLSSQNSMLQRKKKKLPLQKDGKSSETFSLSYEYIFRTEMTYRL